MLLILSKQKKIQSILELKNNKIEVTTVIFPQRVIILYKGVIGNLLYGLTTLCLLYLSLVYLWAIFFLFFISVEAVYLRIGIS